MNSIAGETVLPAIRNNTDIKGDIMSTVYLILGAAGSGKTHFITSYVRNFHGQASIGVVFNDDGDPDATDLPDDLSKYADITSMTAGCFGCADSDVFLDRIKELQEKSVEVILVEPVGFTDAGEMLETLAVIGVKPVVVAMVDAQHHQRNLDIGTAEGHVLVADHTLVTKLENRDPEFDILSWVNDRCPAVTNFSRDGVFDIRQVKRLERYSHCCGHDHAHDHDHSHGHAHFHLATFHARLSTETTLAEVQAVLEAYPNVLRAKGDVNGEHFSMVQGTWEESRSTGGVDFITFYTAPQHREEGHKCLEALKPYYAKGWGGLTGTAAATRGNSVNVDTVRDQLALCEKLGVTFSGGHPVPNPERQEVLNELRKRPTVPQELQRECVAARVGHYMGCGRWYLQNPKREADEAAALRLHAIAVGIGWFVSEMPDRLAPEIIEVAEMMPVAHWLALGLSARTRTNRVTTKELVIADEAGVTARWSLSVGQDPAGLEEAWQHNIALARAAGDDKLVNAWEASRPWALSQ